VGVATLYTGFATGLWCCAVALVVDGLTTAARRAAPAAADATSYPPSVRVRVSHLPRVRQLRQRARARCWSPCSPACSASPGAASSWCSASSARGHPVTLRLRDPGFGRWDTQRCAQRCHERSETWPRTTSQLGFFEITRRLLLIPTVKKLLVGFTRLRDAAHPVPTFLSFYLDEELGFGPGERGLFFAARPRVDRRAGVYGSAARRLFRRDPGAGRAQRGAAPRPPAWLLMRRRADAVDPAR
jgi:hypothetical protein